MYDYINSVDNEGESVVEQKLVGGTIVRFADDRVQVLGRGTFKNCASLQAVDLPNLQTMGEEAFSNSPYLTKINLHSLSSIPQNAFQGATGLIAVILPDTTKVCTLSDDNAIPSGTMIYVPLSLLNTYKSSDHWSSISARIKPIESYLYTVSFYSEDGATLLYQKIVSIGERAIYGGVEPTKSGYTFSGWSKTVGGVADYMILTCVNEDLSVYACFESN